MFQGENWRVIVWFIFAVWLALMILPREAVMWGLVVVAVGMILTRSGEIAKSL